MVCLAFPEALSDTPFPPEANAHQLCPPDWVGTSIRPSSECPGTLVRSLGSGLASYRHAVSQNGGPQALRKAGSSQFPLQSQAMATPSNWLLSSNIDVLSVELSSPDPLLDCSCLTGRAIHKPPGLELGHHREGEVPSYWWVSSVLGQGLCWHTALLTE